MGKPHGIVIPYPAQGHVRALMELSHRLANCGFKITFINTDFTHKLIVDSLSTDNKEFPMISLISIPDGLEPEDDRNDLTKLYMSIINHMPQKLEEIIQSINGKPEDDDIVSCIIADENMDWAFQVAAKMGIQKVAFSPLPAAISAQAFHIGKLIDDGIIDDEGNPTKDQAIDLSPGMPAAMGITANSKGHTTKEIVFHSIKRNRSAKIVNAVPDWIICNSAIALEPAAFNLYPRILPIGPLQLIGSRLGHSSGCFWPEDTTCLEWLDQQPAKSVIYAAFGSFTLFEPKQFEELALGLEHSGKRFLWVIRPDSSHPYPDGFQTRTSTRGRIVNWAPQKNVLSHPSVACFLSHCGWNSTMEGVSNGVPFLCWPYFGDQFMNQDYICNFWKTGLPLDKDENGIITRSEIMEKVKHIYTDEDIRRNATKLMEMVEANAKDGGQSSDNFKNFLEGFK